MAELDEAATSGTDKPGHPVSISCPECHGAMNEVRTGHARHYRCHVGHAYGPVSLLEAQAVAAEAALWAAVASLEEQASVHRALGGEPREGDLLELRPDLGAPARSEHLREADLLTRRARLLRGQLRLTADATTR